MAATLLAVSANESWRCADEERMDPRAELDELGITQPRKAKLAAARELHAFLRERLLGTEGYTPSESGRLQLAILARACSTYQALIELLDRGFSEQAGMLIRPLFEALVDSHWVEVNPEQAVERLAEHRVRVRDLLQEESRMANGRSDIEVAFGLRLDKSSPHFKTSKSHWTGTRSLNKRIEVVESGFPIELPPGPAAFDAVWNRMANWFLHGSSSAFDVTVREVAGGRALLMQTGTSDEYLDEVLLASAWLGVHLAWVVLRLNPPTVEKTKKQGDAPSAFERLPRLFLECLWPVAKVSLVELEEVGEDDECPCGSGKPASRCHKHATARRHMRAKKDLERQLKQYLARSDVGPDQVMEAISRSVGEFLDGFDERENGRTKPPTGRPTGKKRRRKRGR